VASLLVAPEMMVVERGNNGRRRANGRGAEWRRPTLAKWRRHGLLGFRQGRRRRLELGDGRIWLSICPFYVFLLC
jgi:hypothetical protein